jgi:hypothetical protein
MKLVISTVGLVVACAAGCASTPVPKAQVASTENAVESARSAGAERVPEASQHMRMADEHLREANNFIKRGDNDKAEGMLRRAEADAALASSLTQEARQKAATDAAIERVRAASESGAPSGPSR